MSLNIMNFGTDLVCSLPYAYRFAADATITARFLETGMHARY